MILNPGSTSTKIAVFQGCTQVFEETVRHKESELSNYPSVIDQLDYRTKLVTATLSAHAISVEELGSVIAIGGLIRPGKAGVYRVNEAMLRDLRAGRYDEHASNLGALIAERFAEKLHIPAYIADAVTADEMDEVGRISGIPEITRLGRSHTLNQKYTARMAAQKLGRSYETSHLVVVHLGGGISVTAHRNGRMVDTNAARGEGPFCIDRAGGVNSFALAKLCFSGKFTREEMLKRLNGNGGVVAYLGTRDFREVEHRMEEGEETACAVFKAMAYQIAKEIGGMCVALHGRVDAIVLTGGMAHSEKLCQKIEKYVRFLAPVMVFPGEKEMQALAEYAERIHTGELIPLEYEQEQQDSV